MSIRFRTNQALSRSFIAQPVTRLCVSLRANSIQRSFSSNQNRMTKLALVQTCSTPDPVYNLESHSKSIREAAKEGAEVFFLPEAVRLCSYHSFSCRGRARNSSDNAASYRIISSQASQSWSTVGLDSQLT